MILRTAAAALDAFSLRARRRMAPLPQLLFRLGDDFQNEWFDLLPGDLSATTWRRFGERLASDTHAALSALAPSADGTAVRQELLDKLEVYTLVRRASSSLGPHERAARREVFEVAAEHALGLDSSHAPWLLEGLGHGHAAAVLAHDPAPRGLLHDLRLSDGALIMAHLGMGMALAEHLCTALQPGDDDGARRVLQDFLALCQANAETAHEDAAVEALGLTVRCFFPELTADLGRACDALARQDPAAARASVSVVYWHGVGRALYFLPLHLLPGYSTVDAALRRLRHEAPHRLALDNGSAGIAYAATLVNLERPLVLERFVRHDPEAVDAAFVEGVASALLLRRSLAPAGPEVDAFLDHPAVTSSPWHVRLIEPVRALLAHAEGGASGGRGPGASAVVVQLARAARERGTPAYRGAPADRDAPAGRDATVGGGAP